jgi:hypothetical protein
MHDVDARVKPGLDEESRGKMIKSGTKLLSP